MFTENRFIYQDVPSESFTPEDEIGVPEMQEDETVNESEVSVAQQVGTEAAAYSDPDTMSAAQEVGVDAETGDEEGEEEESAVSQFGARTAEVFGGAMSTLNELLEKIKSTIEELLASWGLEVGEDEVPENLQIDMRIMTDGSRDYVVNPETGEEIDINPAYDEDNNGILAQDELNNYLDVLENSDDADTASVALAASIREAGQAQVRNASTTAEGNIDLDNASDDEVSRASRRPPETEGDIGERVVNSPLYNLKYRANNQGGARVLTSGYPGSENSRHRSTSELNSQYPDLSDRAIDVYYAYINHGINNIFSLSHSGDTRQAVEELENAGMLGAYGDINLDSGTLNTSSRTLTRGNMRVLADAYNMYRSCGPNDTFLSHCTHGAHRAVFTMLSCYIIENNCTREEAQSANGVPADFIESYGFNDQLDEIQANRDTILSLS